MPSVSDLEENGWRQGAFVSQVDIPSVIDGLAIGLADHAELIVISQSCDLAQDERFEPFVEAILAEPIAKLEGNYSFNKNPRMLDITVSCATGSTNIPREQHLRLAAAHKVCIPKPKLYGRTPDKSKVISTSMLHGLAQWLAARYDRPALPTAFNDALDRSDPGGKKRKKFAKAINPQTTGVYVSISPDREITASERYSVNLLGLVLPGDTVHLEDVEKGIQSLANIMTDAGIEVEYAVRTEDEIPVSTFRRFKRFYFDDLSYKTGDSLPAEVQRR